MSSMNWGQWNQQLLEMIGRCRSVSRGSRTGLTVGNDCQMIFSNNPDWNRGSVAASVTDGSFNKAKVIVDFLSATR